MIDFCVWSVAEEPPLTESVPVQRLRLDPQQRLRVRMEATFCATPIRGRRSKGIGPSMMMSARSKIRIPRAVISYGWGQMMD